MRSNSGKDEGRNTLHDSTLRDRKFDRGDTATVEKKPKDRPHDPPQDIGKARPGD